MAMTTDLPKRPAPNEDEQGRIVKATDRVKSAADKPDARFEAARLKAEREQRFRAKRQPESGDTVADETAGTERMAAGEPDTTGDGGTEGGFSFNMTAGDAEEEQER
jgi:hypothetical protein